MTDMFIKTSLTGTKAEGWIKDGGTWHKLGGAGLTGLGGWADITATTGNPTKHQYKDAAGNEWVAYEFTAGGSVTTTEGLCSLFMIGGGGTLDTVTNLNGGGGSYYSSDAAKFTAGAHTVTVGTGGITTNHADRPGSHYKGRPSSVATFVTAYSFMDNGNYPQMPSSNGFGVVGGEMGVLNDFATGANQMYGARRDTANYPGGTRNPGDGTGSQSTQAPAGVVIIRVPKDHAKA